MGFLTKEGLQNLTNKLVQGDAIKVASHRGKNVKEVIDNIQRECENVALPNTMILENRVNEFKIGQGRDVDVSGDVEEGKIEVELQGKTYQNLVEYIADYEGYEKNGSYYNKNASRKLSFGLKPNTVYTRILDVKECFEPFWMYDSINNSDGTYRQYSYRIKQGLVINKFTSSDLGTINSYTFNPDQNVTKKENFNIVIGKMILLEGDHTQTPVEELPKYFDGIKSSFEDGVVDVEVVGKNLIEKNSFETGNGLLDITNVIKTGETYSLSYKIDSMSSDTPYIRLRFQGRNKDGSTDYFGEVFAHEYIGKRVFPKPLKFNKQYEKIELLLQVFNHGATCSISDVQLEMSTVATSYEPYYKKKISFNIGEPLRSLPNGVCDEIRNNNGQWELVRKTAKVIFDGSEIWSKDTHNTGCVNTSRFFSIIRGSKVLLNPICNYPVLNMTTYSIDKENIQIASDGNIYIRILNYKLPTLDVEGFKKWLQANPTTVVYELATPTITPIEPIEFDVKPLATMTINSDIAPISNHKVILNRAGQIEQGIELIANLKSRINELEDIYDSNLIATQYKLDNLKLNYELEREED